MACVGRQMLALLGAQLQSWLFFKVALKRPVDILNLHTHNQSLTRKPHENSY